MPRSLLPLLLAPILAVACSSSASRTVRPIDLFGSDRPSSRVSDHDLRISEHAGTYALVAGAEAVPQEFDFYVGSLLERRGWRRDAAVGGADVEVVLTDGSAFVPGRNAVHPQLPYSDSPQMHFDTSTFGGGDVLDRTVGDRRGGVGAMTGPPVRLGLLGVRLVGGKGSRADWEALAWDELVVASAARHVTASAPFDALSAARLLAALADRLPPAPSPSAERRALDQIGADLLVLPAAGGEALPVVLSVEAGSAVAAAGWRPRDVLLEVGGSSVRGVGWSEIARRLSVAEREPVRVELLRAGERYLTFVVPAPVLRPLP